MRDATVLELRPSRGWRTGFGPVLSAELAGWFGTRRWAVQLLIWVLVINGILFAVLQSERAMDPADVAAQQEMERALLQTRAQRGDTEARAALERRAAGTEVDIPEPYLLYSIFTGLFVSVGIVLGLQGSVVGERRSGTAQWVLSGPVTRAAFITAKLGANALGFLAVTVVVPGVLAWVELKWIGLLPVQAGRMALAGAVLFLHGLFYLTLTLMTSTVFRHWAPAAGVPLGLIGLQSMLSGVFPGVVRFLPWFLAIPDNRTGRSAAIAILAGMQVDPVPIVSTAVMCVVLVATAVLVFRRQEL